MNASYQHGGQCPLGTVFPHFTLRPLAPFYRWRNKVLRRHLSDKSILADGSAEYPSPCLCTSCFHLELAGGRRLCKGIQKWIPKQRKSPDHREPRMKELTFAEHCCIILPCTQGAIRIWNQINHTLSNLKKCNLLYISCTLFSEWVVMVSRLAKQSSTIQFEKVGGYEHSLLKGKGLCLCKPHPTDMLTLQHPTFCACPESCPQAQRWRTKENSDDWSNPNTLV